MSDHQQSGDVTVRQILGLQAGVRWTELGRRRHAGLVGRLHERDGELAAVEASLSQPGGVLLIEGGAGVGKTSLVEAACSRADELGHQVVRARGSELESGFAFGVVRQLFERRLAAATQDERAVLLAGPAAAVWPLLSREVSAQLADDSSFAVLHGLYWLVVNLAAGAPLLIAVDDAYWADEPSLRWLAYLAPRLEGLPAGVVAAVRPGDPPTMSAPLAAVRGQAAVLRPALLSEPAVSAVVRAAAGGEASDELCAAVYQACGGNPLYLAELLRAALASGQPLAMLGPAELLAGGLEGIARQVIARVTSLGPGALDLAQALAVLGDGGELRHAAAIAGAAGPNRCRRIPRWPRSSGLWHVTPACSAPSWSGRQASPRSPASSPGPGSSSVPGRSGARFSRSRHPAGRSYCSSSASEETIMCTSGDPPGPVRCPVTPGCSAVSGRSPRPRRSGPASPGRSRCCPRPRDGRGGLVRRRRARPRTSRRPPGVLPPSSRR